NPFDNTEKSVPVRAVSLVRNGDNGGADATGSEPSPLSKTLILFRQLAALFPSATNATEIQSGYFLSSLRDRQPAIGSAARR
ncbi:hypothetical protein, partial [Roseovarius sp. ZX-A-9]|uniref:hypothetical protein n=1 Tax=Roseovarius sp. ZX-A-9 TaxID=3014783 RepID=UPI00232C31A9